MKNWNIKHIQQLEKSGKIRGYHQQVKESKTKPAIPAKVPKAITWLDWNLQYWSNEKAVTMEKEYRFHHERKYRFDYAWPAWKIAVEYEGGIFMAKSGHTNAAGVQRDIDKYALAEKEGWRVIRITAMSYKNVIQLLNQII